MAVRRLLAFVGLGLIVVGTLAAVVAVTGPSSRVLVARTGAGISLRTSAAGKGEAPLDQTRPFVAYDAGKGAVFVANIPVGFQPDGVAYDSGKGEVFVTNYGSNNVTVISDATNAVVANIPVGSHPHAIAYDGGRGDVFVTNAGSNGLWYVTVISDSTNAVV